MKQNPSSDLPEKVLATLDDLITLSTYLHYLLSNVLAKVFEAVRNIGKIDNRDKTIFFYLLHCQYL